MEKFKNLIAEILEVDETELNETTAFREATEDWDSMMGFSIICMLEDEYNTKITVDSFIESKTIGDLYMLVNK